MKDETQRRPLNQRLLAGVKVASRAHCSRSSESRPLERRGKIGELVSPLSPLLICDLHGIHCDSKTHRVGYRSLGVTSSILLDDTHYSLAIGFFFDMHGAQTVG